MYKFGKRSIKSINTLHQDLQLICNELIKVIDVTILEGHRTKEKQDECFEKGYSKVKWPNSKHNLLPSRAVDIIAYPIDFKDYDKMYYVAGIVMGIAHAHGISIRFGGDWNMNNNFKDQNFMDLCHFELTSRPRAH